MLITKLNAVFSTAMLVLIHATPLVATTVVIIITPKDGIVIATDSLSSMVTAFGSDVSRVGEKSDKKYVIVQDRIVVADVGTAAFDGGDVHYDFMAWMKRLEPDLPRDVTINDLAATIGSEGAKTFASISTYMERGQISPVEYDDLFRPFVQYLLIGYQGGVATVRLVEFYMDWDRKMLVGPKNILIEPRGNGDFKVQIFGIREAITEFTNRDSYAYEQTMAACPSAFTTFMQHRTVRLDGTQCLGTALVNVEKKIDPSDVGGSVQIIGVAPDGRAYEKVDSLPEPKAPAKDSSKKH